MEQVDITTGSGGGAPDGEFTVLSWNIGYGGLGEESDFFMDGGEGVRPEKEQVEKNLAGIQSLLTGGLADVCLLQEVDVNAGRSYGKNEKALLSLATGGNFAYATNYRCLFVPFPLPPIGRVESGIMTVTGYTVASAERIALPCPFSWPLRVANLKRCLLVSYMDLEGTDARLVVVNLHLEAYDSGEGKLAQTEALMGFLRSEYEKGNYVVAGGDFNQVFPGALEAYPNAHGDLWTPGTLEEDALPEGFSYAYDLSSPTCRLLNQPYDPSDTEGTQYYVIDGFILSPNVALVSVETLDEGFRYSDHNPVKLTVELK